MLSKMYYKAIVVACLVSVLGMFVGSARADYLYTYGFDGLSDGNLNGQDNWVVNVAEKNEYNQVSHGATGWTGPYAETTTNLTSVSRRDNDTNWGYSLQSNLDFDFSIKVRTDDDTLAYGILAENSDIWSDAYMLLIADSHGDKLKWAIGYDTPWSYEIALPTAADTTWLLGLEAYAEGGNKYTVKPYYQNLTTSGAKTYATTAEHVDSYSLTGLDTLVMYLRAYDGAPRMDDFRISQVVPEPGTLALLVTGLIGLLAYAWRKRK